MIQAMSIPITIEMVKKNRARLEAAGRPISTPPNRAALNADLRIESRIAVIKFVRTFTDLGLKEAKDIVDEHTEFGVFPGNPSRSSYMNRLPLKKALSPIFQAYDLNIFDDDEMDSPEARACMGVPSVETNDAILRGVATALETWQAMGYKNPYEACMTVLRNLSGKF